MSQNNFNFFSEKKLDLECPKCYRKFSSFIKPGNYFQCPSCKQHFINQKNIQPVNKPQVDPLIQDSRFLTSHLSARELANQMSRALGINNPTQFRQYLQNHGDEILRLEREQLEKENLRGLSTGCSNGWRRLWNL